MKKKGNISSAIKNVFVGDIHVPDKYTPGLFKTHDYRTLRIAPTVDNDNKNIDTLIKTFHVVLNRQMFKNLRGGQPVVASEFYADSKESFYLYTVPTKYVNIMKERIQSSFKGGGVKEYDHKGWPFVEDHKNTLIATLQLTKHPYFPISMDEKLLLCKDILHVTENLKGGDKVFIQVLIEPAEDGWQSDLERAYEEYLLGGVKGSVGSILKSGGKKIDELITNLSSTLSSDVSASSAEIKKHRQIKEFSQKRNQKGFHVSIRLVAEASSYERRNDLIEGIAAAYKTGSSQNSWELSPVLRKSSTLLALRNRQTGLMTSQSLLCEDELKTLLFLPTKEVETFRLDRMRPDESVVDERITKDIIPAGKSIEYGSKGKIIGFNIANDDTASKGRLWVAPPGSGKTTAVVIFMQGAMEVQHGGSLFDIADGSLYYGAIEGTKPENRDRLVLVNFTDQKYPHIFNFSSLGSDSDTIGAMFAEFFEVFFKTQSNHRMNSFLRKASMTIFTNPDNTFLELILLMRDEDFRKKFLPSIRKDHPELFLWWKTEFPKIAKSESQITEILQPILYRLDNLQFNKNLGPIFCGRGGKLDIYNWMNQGKWVLYNLSNGVFLENEQRMLMSFLNYAYWTATLQRESILRAGKRLRIHHKMYDEPQTYMNATPIFELSISKSRKYRVSDNFLIQTPTQVIDRNKALWTQILDMQPHIILGGGLNMDNLKIMADQFGLNPMELKQLEQLEYHWYFKTYVGKNALKPFIFDGSGLPPAYGKDRLLEEKWRRHFAPKTIDEVKLDNNARNFKLSVDEYIKLIESYNEPDTEEGVPLGPS